MERDMTTSTNNSCASQNWLAGLGGFLVGGALSGNGCGNGGLSNIFGGGNNDCYVRQSEAALQTKLAESQAEVSYFRGQDETNKKISETVVYINNENNRQDAFNNAKFDKLFEIEKENAIQAAVNKKELECQAKEIAKLEAITYKQGEQLCEQKAYNAANNAVVGCLKSQVDELITTVVKSDKVCNTPFPVSIESINTLATALKSAMKVA